MADFIHIEITNEAIMGVLDRLIASGENLHPAMDNVGMAMESIVSGRFETTTDPNGLPWAPWKPSTVKSYPKDGNGRLLNRYGDMLDSLNYQADDMSVVWGFGVPYAIYHETGTEKMDRRGMLTAEPDLGLLGEADQTTILEIFNSFLLGGLEG